MGNCDMCNRPVAAATVARFSPAQVQAAARAGYRPAAARGESELWQGLGLSPTEARHQAEAAWLDLVQRSPTEWALCAECVAEFTPYLQGKVASVAPIAVPRPQPAAPRTATTARSTPTPQAWLQKWWWALAIGAVLLLALIRGVVTQVTERAMTLPAPTLARTLPTTASFIYVPTFSPDGRLLAVRSIVQTGTDLSSRIEVWEVATGQLLHTLTPDTNGVDHLAMSADGRLLAVADSYNRMELWDLSTEQRLLSLTMPEVGLIQQMVSALALSPDGRWLAAAGSGGLYLWDTTTGTLQPSPSQHMDCSQLSFSPDGRWVACHQNLLAGLIVWDNVLGQAHSLGCGAAKDLPPRFSADGQQLAVVGGTPAQFCLWQVAGWQSLPAPQLPELTHPIDLAFTADLQFLTVLGMASEQEGLTRTLWLWDLKQHKLRASRADIQTTEGRISPDGKILMLSNSLELSQRLTLWDLAPIYP